MSDIEFNSALITGGAGFIGSHLADKLVNEGIETKVLDNFATGRKENFSGCIDKQNFSLFNLDLLKNTSFNLSVSVKPGNILFTVIPYSPNSNDKVLAQFATAPLIVFEIPRPLIGSFTEVDVILIILPKFSFFILYSTLN